ncbi:MAG TPA: peptidoglycan bridge formation glycyltransferase FemA/FemB family protein [Candidatus Dormibacteraeota bacterium]|nr:peptidoglycan bridge formation glycyltransferase FemA/FemB family protein [Candidatus Dormibacteraeota bacterium]
MINTGIPQESWDEALIELGGGILQSRAWAQFQADLGRKVVYGQGEGWMWCGSVVEGRGVKYLYVPYGPAVGTGEDWLRSLQAAGKQEGVDFVRFEPIGNISQEALSRGRRIPDMQPSRSWVLDLSSTPEQLRANLSSGNRNIINKSERSGLVLRSSSSERDIKLFLDMLHDTAGKSGFRPHSDKYMTALLATLMPQGATKLFFAGMDGKEVAGAIGFDFGGTRYYAHAASFQQLNKELQAARPLVWHMILDAKAAGLTKFDFWGVAPSDQPNHPWAGLSKFKQSFGGEPVEYAGTYDIPIKSVKYLFYRLVKRILPL